ncbi:phenylalanine--tRNA ligase subunit alpha [Clostridium thermosuccinogenes]|uniref:Phenylalanine--tRNA ligase alpha subunit n=1 Tax=Clostridium thermosuccinogenes TaxID=84032 RepID=A0A2K2F965_9CLOT|nr:phenylalanine--tRNA ligase subunit alpha [Pseudoclostridium thermosuccinogenes]AUS98769.1 phenylalanine--tRNA ligase subunit alpha [Pseudoclostridium thermosuccinogenes]PNT95339.1 phenylalanine--tRNA ligase subunit alpha [Pseudoclostridium thermosuccinogenes]PNT96352.1 phenylalanine--tRNA ligase subunit alpha [Pseudoclostridium thermosuccinogenes]
MREQLNNIKAQAEEALSSVSSIQELENVRVKYLGKKGELTAVLRGMGALSAEERPVIGQLANEVRQFIEDILTKKMKELAEAEKRIRLEKEKIDITMPGRTRSFGKRHPLTQVIDEIKEVFLGMGYQIAEGPEVELDYFNFEAMNIPKNHPSRDVQDTFYIDGNVVLRTHTSPVQARVMKTQKPPIRIICPGRVYRSDEVDATHSPVFHQIEGLVVDKGVTMGDLVGTLQVFAKALFGEDTKIRLRPHHFPFTEPSAEVDVSCWSCHGSGCRVCKGEGWVEILGAGMVSPKVLRECGIDPDEYSGFAFGLGVERVAMARFNIDDMRLFTENDVRFLMQF